MAIDSYVVNAIAACVLGVGLNLVLLIIIQLHTPAALREYARLLRLHVANDVFYELFNVATCMVSRQRQRQRQQRQRQRRRRRRQFGAPQLLMNFEDSRFI